MDLMEMGNEREKGSILLNQLYHQVYVFLFGTSNVSKIINHGSKHSPFALIIDFFSTSALPIAKELHLPTYYFYTSVPSEGHPNVQPMLDRDHPAYWDDMLYFYSHLPKSDGIIDNTFEELEPTSTLKGYSSRSERIILTDSTEGDSKRVGDKWDGKRFLWVVKKPPVDVKTKQLHGADNDFDLEGLLPEGFLDRTNDRGMVVKSWAPQAAVLKKESVCGFVTHCRPNSVLEAVVSGVPLIAWPLYAEQHLNRNNLVKVMEIATKVEEREEDGVRNVSTIR
ncbi:hypothetical protein ACFX1X_004410 [Malus domestica]